MFFDDSRPDRRKRADKSTGVEVRSRKLESSPIPPVKSYELLTFDEILNGGNRTLIMDTESYVNYWLVAFQCLESGKVIYFEDTPTAQLDTKLLSFIMHRFLIVGFNSKTYDVPMIQLAMQGVRAPKLKEISDEIIQTGLKAFEVERMFNIKPLNINHIDLIEVAPIQASLKTYAGRLHCPRMQDLPFSISATLEYWQACAVRDYCVNDLENTALLYKELMPHICLREALGKEYGLDLRSKSDAQIAEAVVKSELQKLGIDVNKPKVEPGQTFFYQVPSFLQFKTQRFQDVLNSVATTPFVVGESGKANCPDAIKALKIALGQCEYQMGNGGLHSCEKSVAHIADEITLLIDRDVASYYPQIVLNQELFPAHLGPAFLKVYRALVLKRLKAKREKDTVTADALKIVINGAFGKLGSQYSLLYSSDLMSQVTVTGQLSLLMLIEAIELVGIPVVSANTDGIVIKCPKDRYADLETVIIAWEEQTGFTTEETRYKALYSRDVNNYIAIKEDGKCKTKGIYSDKGSALNSPLSKNPETLIVSDAVQKFLAEGVPVQDTIYACRDFRRFVSVRAVKGGAEKDGVYLGKSIRWYYAYGVTGEIKTVLYNSAVPKSQGAKPCMDLPAYWPNDINYEWYINEANDMLYDLGHYRRAKQATLF